MKQAQGQTICRKYKKGNEPKLAKCITLSKAIKIRQIN